MNIAWKTLITLTLMYLALPIVGLLTQLDLAALPGVFSHDRIYPALTLSLTSALASTGLIVVVGTPLAWKLAEHYKGQPPTFIQLIIQWPLVLPPSVLGLALLDTYGSQGLISTGLAFSPSSLVVIQTIVAAPFFLQVAFTSFIGRDSHYADIASTLGASPGFIARRILWPLHRWALIGGASLSFARSLGEFGATLIFAGNLPGVTQTMPLAIYEFLESDLQAARVLALLLLLLGMVFIGLAIRLSLGRRV